ncbi:MAG: vitamin K epoxide reductase family protein [Lachnospiraceae bacterium]|nr:vitamin K epoxide reductase family protein [Lachnospiraceae bacterium]
MKGIKDEIKEIKKEEAKGLKREEIEEENMEKKDVEKLDMKKKDTGKEQRKRMTSRQAVAIIGVALLFLLYIVTLIMAFADSSASGQWFRLCLFGTLAVSVVIWLYSWMYGRMTGKKAIGDPEIPDTEGLSGEKTESGSVQRTGSPSGQASGED